LPLFKINEQGMAEKKALFEEEARSFLANFDRDYKYSSHYISIKTKLYGEDANRECITDVLMGGRVMQVMPTLQILTC